VALPWCGTENLRSNPTLGGSWLSSLQEDRLGEDPMLPHTGPESLHLLKGLM